MMKTTLAPVLRPLLRPMLAMIVALGGAASGALAPAALAQTGPLRITITDGVIEPMPYAIPDFIPEGGAQDMATNISRVVASDLSGTGLFREIPSSAFISRVASFDAPIAYPDWKAINAQALITGAVSASGNQVVAKFCLFDVFAGQQFDQCMQFAGPAASWRRVAHKVADTIYSRITGEGAYFDSRVAFVAESGPKDARQKRLAVMDYDGANLQYLTDASSIIIAPRFSPDGRKIIFTSYASGSPQIYVMDTGSLKASAMEQQSGTMTFSPRFAPDGRSVVFSLERGGNTDIYAMDIASGATRQLTNTPSIETSPSFSPDGSQIVFESDRSGAQQIYVMPASGGEAVRLSGGNGRYGTPVWSPKGDYIAFTKQNEGRFYIGVMRADGSEERLLTASFLDEGPTWAPNGRVIMFTRETPGATGAASLYSVDITGRNLKKVAVQTAATDPAWSPLLP